MTNIILIQEGTLLRREGEQKGGWGGGGGGVGEPLEGYGGLFGPRTQGFGKGRKMAQPVS